MMEKKQLSIFVLGILMFSVLTGLSFAGTDGADIVEVRLDGKTLSENGNERLVVSRGETLELEFKIELGANSSSVEDLQVIAFITGYKHSEYNPLIQASDVFHIKKNKGDEGQIYSRWESLELELPEDMESGSYKLRIVLSNKDGDATVNEYNLDIECIDEKVSIADIMLSPNNYVQAGSYLIGQVRVRNEGNNDEDNVKVILEIPELSLQAISYIDEIEEGESVSSEEVALKIPVCTEEGEYEVKATVYFDDLYKSVSSQRTIHIVESDACELTKEPYKTPEKTIVSIAIQQADVMPNEAALFPITIVNTGKTATTVSFEVQGADWANVEFKPSNILIVKGEESEVISLYVTPKEDVEGSKVLTLNIIKEGKVAQQVPFTVNVEKGEEEKAFASANLRLVLEVAIVILVIVLVIIGLVLAFRKMKGNEEEDTQTYY